MNFGNYTFLSSYFPPGIPRWCRCVSGICVHF